MPTYRFGDVAVDTDRVEIVGSDGVRDVEPQVFEVLRYLIEQPGRLVTKEELLDNVWGDRFVSESALTTRIKQARRAVGDDGRTQWAIKTVHGRGYRFVAEPVEHIDEFAPIGAEHTNAAPLPEQLKADTRQMFVGREDEHARGVAILERDHNDRHFGWIWLLGEPGIGKTRLAAELARSAHVLGHRVLFGRNNEDLRVAHQPFIEMMRSAIEQMPADGRASFIASVPPDLALLLPDLVASDAALQIVDDAAENEMRRYRLFETMIVWLIESTVDIPLTLIIDDLHWAADSTVQMLAHIQNRHDGAPINFIVTARDTAPDINPSVADLLAAAQGNPQTCILRLDGLSETEARHIVGQHVEIELAMQQTAGNPLLLQAVNENDGSVDIASAVRRRLANLDDAVQETLQIVATLGLEFELAVATAATGRDELDLLDDLEHAIAARLLDDVGFDRFRFTHALIRSSLRDGLSSSRRARMHRRTAEAIEQLFPGERRHLPALAFHTAEAAAADESLRPLAIARLVEAASESMRQLSFDEAATALERAVHLTEPGDTEQRSQLLLEQGIAQMRAGANMTAAHTFEQAVTVARLSKNSRLRIEAAIRYEDAAWRPGMSGLVALGYLSEATRLLDEMAGRLDGELKLRARLALGRLRALALTGRIDDADVQFAEAHRLARELGSPTLEASALNIYITHVRLIRRLAGDDLISHTGEDLIARLAELQPNIDDGDVALHAAHAQLLHATIYGDFARARELDRLMGHLQEQSRSLFWRFIRTNQEAMRAFYLGDLGAAEQLAEHCLELADQLPEEDGSGTFGLRMFMIRREQDQLRAIAPLVRHVLAAGDVTGVWTPGLAMLLVETGDADGAASVLAEIKEAGFEVPVDAMWSTVLVFLIETMVSLGDADACAQLLEQFAPLAGKNVTTGSGLLCFGRADRYLGMLSLVMGDLAAAEQYLGSALEGDSAGQSKLWENESRLWLSRVRRAQGHSVEADAMLAVVRQQAGAAGLARLERLATPV